MGDLRSDLASPQPTEAADSSFIDTLRNAPQIAASQIQTAQAQQSADQESLYNPAYSLREDLRRPKERLTIPRILEDSANQKKPWSEVKDELESLGGVDSQAFQPHYQAVLQGRKLTEARAAQEKEEEQEGPVGRTLREFYHKGIPFVSAVRGFRETKHLAEAQKRFAAGQATDEDYATIAEGESAAAAQQRLQQRAGKIGAGILGVAESAPAIIGESLAGGRIATGILGPGVAEARALREAGRLTGPAIDQASLAARAGNFAARQAISLPFMPSMYAEQAAQKNLAAGRDAGDLRGFGTAAIMGYSQNLILGTMQSGLGEKSLNAIGRVAAKGAVGMGEQQIADLAMSGLDELFLKRAKMGTGAEAGLLGKLVRGEFGDAGTDAAIQMSTFALFAGLHELQGKPEAAGKMSMKEAMDDWMRDSEAYWKYKKDAAVKTGLSEPAAGATASAATAAFTKRIASEVKDSKTREEFLGKFHETELNDPRLKPLIEGAAKRIPTEREAKAEADKEKPKAAEVAAPEATKLPEPPTPPAVPAAPKAPEPFEGVSDKGLKDLAKTYLGIDLSGNPKRETVLKKIMENPIGQRLAAEHAASAKAPEMAPSVAPSPEPPVPPATAPGTPTAAPERFYRVPDYKGGESNVDAAVKELIGDKFAGKWFSRGREQNESYHTSGKAQFEFRDDKLGGEGDVVERGEKEVRIGGNAPMYMHPALSAIRYKGKPEGRDYEKLKGVVDDANKERAARGLEPIHLEATEATPEPPAPPPEPRVGQVGPPAAPPESSAPKQRVKSEYQKYLDYDPSIEDVRLREGESPTDYAKRLIKIKPLNEADLRLIQVPSHREATRILDSLVRSGEAVKDGSAYVDRKIFERDKSGQAAKPAAPPAPKPKLGLVDRLRAAAAAKGQHAKVEPTPADKEIDDARNDTAKSGAKDAEIEQAQSDGEDEGVSLADQVASVGRASPNAPETVPQAPDHPTPPAGINPNRIGAQPTKRGAQPITFQGVNEEQARGVMEGMTAGDWVGLGKDSPQLRDRILELFPELAADLAKVKTKEGIQLAIDKFNGVTEGGSEAAQPETIPTNEEVERKINESGLAPNVKAGLMVLARNGGGAESMKASGLSKQAIQQAGVRLFGESIWSQVQRAAQERYRALKDKLHPEEAVEKESTKQYEASQQEEMSNEDWLIAQDRAEGAPIPGVTKGAHASDPVETQRIEDGMVERGVTAVPAGGAAVPSTPGLAAAEAARVASGIRSAFRWFGDTMRSLAGNIAPRISRYWPELGNRLARYAASGEWGKRSSEYYKEQILGPLTDQARREADESGLKEGAARDEFIQRRAKELGKQYQAAFYEERFRLERAHEEAIAARADEAVAKARTPEDKAAMRKEAAEARVRAANIKTMLEVVGADLPNEKAFQDVLNSDGYKAFGTRWKPFSDKMDELFHQALGVDKSDLTDSVSQLPGRIFHAKAVAEGEIPDEGHVFFESSKGRLANPKMSKLGSANKFTGAAAGYDIDPARVIDYTIYKRLRAANKAAFVREAVSSGAAVRVAPGADVPQGWREIPNVFKPSSTGAPIGTAQQTSLYAHPEAYGEMRRAFEVDQPPGSLPGTQTLTTAALASLVEATTHARNLLTFAFKPGVNVVQMFRNLAGVIRGDADTMKRITDLAEIGAMKPSGMETQIHDQGVLWGGKFDPTYWIGKFQKATLGKVLDVMDKTMRLTADDAFTNLVNRKLIGGGGEGIENTEQNRRDFINQLGNYQRQTQHWLVAWLRDTGLGPFATAGSNYTVQGIRALTGNPGVKTVDNRTAALLRAEYIARIGGIVGLTALLNYLQWGNASGDDNTPFGGLKVTDGKKTGYIDMIGLTGWYRGARTTGVSAAIEGTRPAAHATGSQILDRAALHDIPAQIMHPGMGPAVQFAHELVTGRDTLGMPIHDKVKPGESEFLANLQAAVLNANPAVSVLSEQTKHAREMSATEKGMKILGPLGLKYRPTPPGKPLPPR